MPILALTTARSRGFPVDEEQFQKHLRFIADFLDLPEDHPSVARACISIMAPFCMLILSDRRRIKRALPSVGHGPDDALDMARHLAQFAIAGLEAVGRDAHKKASLRPQQNNR